MIELFTWSTPNGRKISIALEELGIPYRVTPVDISAGEQYSESFLRFFPNNKIPAIIDHGEDLRLMESGAILLYLAEKSDRLIPKQRTKRWQAVEWLEWQIGGLGPSLGQLHHYMLNPGKSEYAEARLKKEAHRLYSVLNGRLEKHEYLATEYSIADIASWCWVARFSLQKIDLAAYPAVLRWFLAIASRPAVQKGYSVPDGVTPVPLLPS